MMLPFIAIKLFGLGRALKAIAAKMRWYHWTQLLLLVAALYWRNDAIEQRQGRDKALAIVQGMKDAQAKAAKLQEAENLKRTNDEKDNANETDRKDAIAQSQAGNAAIVYRDRWRVRNICASSQANPAPADSAAESGNGAGDAANMVAISVSDFDRCTANSVRLQSVKQWGDGLIAKGLAVEVAP